MTMNCFPDFSDHGYQIKKELGANRAGGRVTYLAIDMATQQSVVIKQFQFARSQSNWADYDTYDREIQVLQELNHPGIPRYLNSFQADDGFCMVQEYKKASSLSESYSFNLAEIKQIAISILEILVYLQKSVPPVIHRDIKPENILVDDKLNVYLVDFGFARVGHGEVAVSSVVKGTLGFMPPEQLFNRQLSEASDLYSLGITLICLLTKTKSDEIGNLIDISYQIKFKHLVPKLSPQWVSWLERMVEPRLKGRYANASTALAAIPFHSICQPEAQLSEANFWLVATRIGEKLIQNVTITNLVPETLLEGTWEVESHPNDPLLVSGYPIWLSFYPVQFTGNQVECQIVVDTTRLMAEKVYIRKLLLHTNSSSKTYVLTLQVQTAPIPIRTKKLPYKFLMLLFLVSLIAAWVMVWCALVVGTITEAPAITAIATTAGVAVGLEGAAWTMSTSESSSGAIASAISGIVVGMATVVLVLAGTGSETSIGGGILLLMISAVGLVGGWILGVSVGIVVENVISRSLSKGFAVGLSLLTSALGAILGSGFVVEFLHPWVSFGAIVNGLLLATLLLRVPLRQTKLIANYRKSERHLVKP